MEKLIVFLVIIFFSIIKSLIDKAAEKKPPMVVPPPRPPAQNKTRVQSEIESFLSEVRSGTAPREMGGAEQSDFGRGPAPMPAAVGQAAPERRQTRPPKPQRGQNQGVQGGSGKNRNHQQQQRTRRRQEEAAARQAAVRQVAADSESGSGKRESVSQHVQQHMKSQIPDHVRADLNSGIRPGSSAESEAAAVKVTAASPTTIIEAIRSPAGIRQAIIINEVLSRPRVLRR